MIAPITARKHPAASPGADRLWACPNPPPRRAPTMPEHDGADDASWGSPGHVTFCHHADNHVRHDPHEETPTRAASGCCVSRRAPAPVGR